MAIKKKADEVANVINWDFGNGKAAEGDQPGTPSTTARFELARVNEVMKTRLALHGASQKIGDSYANAKEASDPIAYAIEACNDTIAQLYAGEWSQGRTGDGIKRSSDLATALHRVSVAQGKPKTEEAWTAYLATLDDAAKKALRAKPAIAVMLLEITAERAAEKLRKAKEAAAATPAATGTDGQPAATPANDELPDVPDVQAEVETTDATTAVA